MAPKRGSIEAAFFPKKVKGENTPERQGVRVEDRRTYRSFEAVSGVLPDGLVGRAHLGVAFVQVEDVGKSHGFPRC